MRIAGWRNIVVAIACGLGFVDVAAAQLTMPEIVQIGIDGPRSSETTTRMIAAVYKPPGDGKWPVLVYSHGRSGNDADRRRIRATRSRAATSATGCKEASPSSHQFGRAMAIRAARIASTPACAMTCSAIAGARPISAEPLPPRRRRSLRRSIGCGSSRGRMRTGSCSPAVDGRPDVDRERRDESARCRRLHQLFGGTGGDSGRAPKHSCGSEEMAALMSTYGKTTRVPGLWLYAENDLYWGAEWPRAWYRAFASAGSNAEFVMTDAVPNSDGHQLLARGGRLWTEHVDHFLTELGF